MDIPETFHFTHSRLVEFADTDMAGIVHFANIFKFVESAEHAFFRSLGASVHRMVEEGQEGWPRLEAACRYLKPVRFEQVLAIRLRVEELRTSSMRYRFWVYEEGAPDDSPLATGEFTIVHVAFDSGTNQMRKMPIPEALRSRLESAVAPP